MKKFFSLGIAGLGNVGLATVKLIQNNSDLIEKKAGIPIKITAVSANFLSLMFVLSISMNVHIMNNYLRRLSST